MPQSDGVVFRTSDGRFGLTLPAEQLARTLLLCEVAGDQETGGLLIGRYTHDLDMAIVDEVTGPGADSHAGRGWFRRGVRALQAILLERWRTQRAYYIGEWHFHPGRSAEPSGYDHAQMRRISCSPEYQCPEPILLIVGGNPSRDWHVSAGVYPREIECQALRLILETPLPATARNADDEARNSAMARSSFDAASHGGRCGASHTVRR